MTSPLALVLLLQVPLWMPEPTPTPTPLPHAPDVLVERTVSIGERMTRVTLFDNRMAVATVRERDVQVLARRRTLSEEEYAVYLAALERDAGAAPPVSVSSPTEGVGTGVITLHPPSGGKREVVYRQGEELDLATARLVTMLDDLERVVSSVSPSFEELREWVPVPGAVVELFNGEMAEVTEVTSDGTVILTHRDTPLIEYLPRSEWANRIRRVVSEPE